MEGLTVCVFIIERESVYSELTTYRTAWMTPGDVRLRLRRID